MQVERALLEPFSNAQDPYDGTASHRAQVLSFQRLAQRILASGNASPKQVLSEAARTMVLRHLVARLAPQLRYYGRAARSGSASGRISGFLDCLAATLRELIQEAVVPDDLDALTTYTKKTGASDDTSGSDDQAHHAKLHDLQLIYRAYLDYLGEQRIDPTQSLDVAMNQLDQCPWLDGASLWVDGFASFSGQELQMLVALARRCGQVDVTVLADPCLVDRSAGSTKFAHQDRRLFRRTLQTFAELRDRFVHAGIDIDEPVLLQPSSPLRFKDSIDLTLLERTWGRNAEQAPAEHRSGISADVSLVAHRTRRIEVDYALSCISRWVQASGGKLRYRDTAIIVRDLEPYHDLITSGFRARNIPFFIDRRRPIAHHPLPEFLRCALQMAREDVSLASVRLMLKTDLLPVTREASDELENYLLMRGIAGRKAWSDGPWTSGQASKATRRTDAGSSSDQQSLERINDTRATIVDALKDWWLFSAETVETSGIEWVEALRGLLVSLSVSDTMEQWADEAEALGEMDQAEEHRQVGRDVDSLLDDLASSLDEARLSLAELSDVLESGLAGMTLGLVPPTVDQVLVGAIERSRHPSIKAAVILGFNDGVFPIRPTEDSLLHDDDRTKLRAHGVRVGQSSLDRAMDEMLLAYVAFTRASEKLVVSYALSDEQGRELRPSPFVAALVRACPGLDNRSVQDPAVSRETWNVLSMRDLIRRLGEEFRARPSLSEDTSTWRGRWNALYTAIRGDWRKEPVSARVAGAFAEQRRLVLSSDSVEQLYDGPLRSSVSRLETFATCAFRHFAQYNLNLQERKEASLEPVDIGLVHHAILEDFVSALSSRQSRLHDLSEPELMRHLQESCQHVADGLPDHLTLDHARNAYILRRSAQELARIVRAQRRISAAGEARPYATELPFGFDKEGGLPALKLITPNGRSVFLRGYIDRVDIAELSDELLGVVIDYKHTKDKRLDLSDVYYGLSLQLVGYMLALASSGKTLAGRPIRPIGALYVSLAPYYQSVDHPKEVSSDDRQSPGAKTPRGLLKMEDFAALDADFEHGRSPYYSVHRKKDGTIGHADRSDAADAPDFDRVMEWTKTRMGELADQILDGDVSVSPFRLRGFSPCSWCPMSTVCRFEMGLSDVRFLESLKRSEVFRKISEEALPKPDPGDVHDA